MAKSRGARTPSYAKTNVLSGSIVPRPYQKKKHLISDIAMVIVKFRPRWLHT